MPSLFDVASTVSSLDVVGDDSLAGAFGAEPWDVGAVAAALALLPRVERLVQVAFEDDPRHGPMLVASGLVGAASSVPAAAMPAGDGDADAVLVAALAVGNIASGDALGRLLASCRDLVRPDGSVVVTLLDDTAAALADRTTTADGATTHVTVDERGQLRAVRHRVEAGPPPRLAVSSLQLRLWTLGGVAEVAAAHGLAVRRAEPCRPPAPFDHLPGWVATFQREGAA